MTQLLAIRDAINNFIHYNRKATYPLLRFVLYGAMLWGYAGIFGYQDSNRVGVGIILLFLIVSSLLFPADFFYFFVSAVTALELYFISYELGIAMILMNTIVYLLYLRYSHRFCLIVLAIPLAYVCHIPCLIPLAVGMLLGCSGIVPVTYGIVIYYFAQYMGDYKTVLSSGTLGESTNGIVYVLKYMNQDKSMWVTMAVFAIVVIIVNYVYHLTLDYAWNMAILAGAVVNILLFLLGGFLMELDSTVLEVVIQTIAATLIASIMQFYLRAVDFSRVERVEFSDDEYYYYVKAIPKVKMGFRNVRTKKISGRTMEEEGK